MKHRILCKLKFCIDVIRIIQILKNDKQNKCTSNKKTKDHIFDSFFDQNFAIKADFRISFIQELDNYQLDRSENSMEFISPIVMKK